MKQHRLAATAATAAAAAIVALGSTGVAHAEANPASSTTRITSAVQAAGEPPAGDHPRTGPGGRPRHGPGFYKAID